MFFFKSKVDALFISKYKVFKNCNCELVAAKTCIDVLKSTIIN